MSDSFTYNVWWQTKYDPLYLEIEAEYTPAERGAREFGTGLQLEPDYAEYVSLLSAKIGNTDILEILHPSIEADIKSYYLDTIREEKNEYVE